MAGNLDDTIDDPTAPADAARSDAAALDLAARLAWRGVGRVEPNPLVGAVIVKEGRVIGLGHHRRFGGPHAEAEALASARRLGHDPRGGTMYVTLEPCRHHGKQPPCTDAILAAGIARVVCAAEDPNPPAAGGAGVLRAAGIRVDHSAASPSATACSAAFRTFVRLGRPWVVAKWAQTIDGRVATRTGESKWISGDGARARVHRLRARVQAILTGIGTVLADDPLLTARPPHRTPSRPALRVVADTDLDIPPTSRLVRTASRIPTLVLCDRDLAGSGVMAERLGVLREAGVEVAGVPRGPGPRGLDLRAALHELASRGVRTLMVEAGPGLMGALFEADCVDEAVVYVAPMLLGDEFAAAVARGRVAESLSAARRFDLWRARPIGHDVELLYRRRG